MSENTQSQQNNTSLTLYGDRDEIRELKDRIVTMLPGVRQLGPAGALALAQVAHSMGLNPFTGEVWAIPQKKGGQIVGFSIMAGIKGLRRAGKTQARREGAVYPYYRPQWRLLSDDEKEMCAVKKGDIALVCQLEVLLRPDHPWYKLNKHQRFIVEGIGIYRMGERTKMEPIQVARKRAEADALKIAFDLPFGDHNANGDYDVIEGEHSEKGGDEFAGQDGGVGGDVPGEDWPSDVQDHPQAVEAERGPAVGPAPPPPDAPQEPPPVDGNDRPYGPHLLRQKLVETAGDSQLPATNGQIPFVARKWRECFAGDEDAKQQYRTALKWVWGVESARQLTKMQAHATLKWLLDPGGPDGTGDTPLHRCAPEEARRIVRQARQDKGQVDMFEDEPA